MSQTISLELPIYPGAGVGDIKLGLSIQDLFPLIKEMNHFEMVVKAYYPRLFEYVYRGSLSMYVDIVRGKLVRIDLCCDYKGTYSNTIGIGSKIGDLRKLRSDIFFDEEYILVGENNELIIRTDYDEQIEDLDSINDATISTISIELPGWMSE
jgi:hypothetical protein